MNKILIIFFFCILHFAVDAQNDTQVSVHVIDTTPKKIQRKIRKAVHYDSLGQAIAADTTKRVSTDSEQLQNVPSDTFAANRKDNMQVAPIATTPIYPIDSFYIKLLNNPFFPIKKKPLYLIINERIVRSKDETFYLLLGLLAFLAVIKLSFDSYFSNIFKQFVQPSFRQKQTREQLSQNNLPSLLLNLFFIISSGAFIALLMEYYTVVNSNFQLNFIYSSCALFILYTAKFIILTFAGWVFTAKDASETYIFIVFLINKVMGIILLPFSFIIAFSQAGIINFSVTISLMIVLILFVYRYIAAIGPVKKEVNVSVSHFIFYILAFEIIPILLIYKTLGVYLAKSA